ncbi:MAG: TonB-dependent receptor [Gammaproteobacteria bacterium]|nr:TonB-dependent receptor [Gammaproteobacteria bacterium]
MINSRLMTSYALGLIGFATLLHPLSAEPEENIENLIVTATRTASDASRHPEVFVLNNAVLESIQAQHIQELLISTPGVNLQRGNGQEYLPAIRSPVFTGAGSCGAILTAQDGIPLRSAGFCNVNELFEAHSEMAHSIEIVRGSGTALYGSNALHGMVNVITPTPAVTPSRWSIETGSDDYARLKVSTAFGDAKKLATFLSATHDGGFRDESGFAQQKLSLRYATHIDGYDIEAGLSATNLNQETAGFITGLDAYKDDARVKSNQTPEAYRDVRSLRGWLSWASEFANGSSFMFRPYFRSTDMQFLQHFLPGDPLEENGQNSFGVQSAFYTALSSNFDLITGIDAEYTDAFLKQSQDQPTQGSAFLMATIPEGKHYDYKVDAKTLAAFVYGDWELTERLNLVSGLRYESVSYDYDNRMLDGRSRDDGTPCGFGGCRYSRPADSKDSFDNLSSHIQVNIELSDTWRTFLKWSKAYRLPQASELYRLQRDQSEANLQPETLQGLEFGALLNLERLHAEVTIYDQDKDNFIFRDSDFFNVSDGQTSHKGVEVFVDFQFNEAFSVAVNANSAKHRYTYDRDLNGINIHGKDIDTAPRHFGSVNLQWTISQQLAAQLQFSHMGDYFLEPENLHSYPGHNLLNLRTQYQWTPEWQWSLRVNNLLDRNYAERADYTSFTDERYFPGRGRSVFVGLQRLF